MSKHYLLSLDYDYISGSNSEILNIIALSVVTESELEDFYYKLDQLSDGDIENYSIDIGFDFYFNFSSKRDFLNSLSFKEITEDFYNDFIANIGKEYGLVYLLELADDFLEYKEFCEDDL
jgi:hypothetical protein